MSTAKTLVMVKNTFIEVESECSLPGFPEESERRPRTESADAVLQYPRANASNVFASIIPETIYEHLGSPEHGSRADDVHLPEIKVPETLSQRTSDDLSRDGDGDSTTIVDNLESEVGPGALSQGDSRSNSKKGKDVNDPKSKYEQTEKQDGDGRQSTPSHKSNTSQSNDDDSDSNGKTTVMLRNIPNKYTQKMILDVINEKFRGLYDFFYLPIDFRNRCNVGYAFINYLHTSYAQSFKTEYQGHKLTAFKSHKVCEVSWGRVQGLKANIEHYRNSAVMSVNIPQYKPLLFSNGMAVPFPDSDRPLPSVKLRPLRGGSRDMTHPNGEIGSHRQGRGSSSKQLTNGRV